MRSVITWVVALAAFALAGFGFIARYLPISNHVVLLGAALSPYLMLGAFISMIMFMIGRRWILAIAASGLAIVAVLVELPLYTQETNRGSSVPVRVMTANLYLGQADPKAVVATADANADVFAVEELTPREVKRLAAAGLDKAFPFRVLDPKAGASGTGLWSRFPITEPRVHGDYVNGAISARIHVEEVATDPTVVVIHMAGPWPQPLGDWARDLRYAPGTMWDAAQSAGRGSVIAAGDFNSTFDMQPFRNLLHYGYHDAAEQSGSGMTVTYPGNVWVPPFIAIDHVLTFRCTATSVKTVRLPGSDHRAVVAPVEVPRSA
jgi:endonuclease/exonuclease/phosphatase (EEP) superfamily protein YafD